MSSTVGGRSRERRHQRVAADLLAKAPTLALLITLAIVTTMLTLVPFVPEHFATLSGWFATEADVVQWGGPLLTYPITPEQLQAMLDESVGPSAPRLCWMTADNGDLIGHAQLGFDWRHGNALLSRVAIAPRARGRGLAIPMLRLVISKAFAFEAIERVELNVYAWNTPAIRTYERLNFRSEGIRRSSARVGEERWDTAIMGLLRSEWVTCAPDTPAAPLQPEGAVLGTIGPLG